MNKYIDSDKLFDYIVDKYDGDENAFKQTLKILSHIKAMRTADEVKVVRCKDCKWRYEGSCLIHGAIWKDHDFCSQGERKEDECSC